MNDFKPGDVVRLKTGGPDMVISMEIPADKVEVEGMHVVHCMWFDPQGNPVANPFPSVCLSRVDGAKVPRRFDEMAQSAYEAYGDKAEWKNFQGNPMPQWEDLPDNIHTYWVAATVHIVSEMNSHYNDRTK